MTHPAPDILCIGSALWDIIGRHPGRMAHGQDVPGRIARIPGGVALNVAVALARFGMRPAFLTSLGQDAEGDELARTLTARGIDCRHAYRDAARPTDAYMAIEDSQGLVAAVADAHSLEAAGELILAPLSDGRLGSAAAPWTGPVVIDGNLTEDLLARIAVSPLFARAAVTVVPASPGKALRLRPLIGMANATLHLNRIEADALAGRASTDAADAARAILGLGASRVIVTDGANLSADGTAAGIVTARPPAVPLRRVTGAGDTCLAAHLVAERRGMDRAAALAAAVRTAARHVAGEDPHEPA
ncbi:MAG: hypothetical protein RLZZ528_2958 [Pseudomonadota bacterium]